MLTGLIEMKKRFTSKISSSSVYRSQINFEKCMNKSGNNHHQRPAKDNGKEDFIIIGNVHPCGIEFATKTFATFARFKMS
jgi:hypothetical protein